MNFKTLVSLFLALFIPCLLFAGGNKADRQAQKEARKAAKEQKKLERQTFKQGQKSENKTFQDSLKGKTSEEKATLTQQHRTDQNVENKAFSEKTHQENMTALNDRLADCKNMTDAQKQDLVTFFQTQYQENVSFREQRFTDNMAFFQKTAADTTLTPEQKKAAIKAQADTWKTTTQQHGTDQKDENKTKRKALRDQIKAQKATNASGAAPLSNP